MRLQMYIYQNALSGSILIIGQNLFNELTLKCHLRKIYTTIGIY